ncbi:MAG: LPXTG cell wall anchor domain-containing protein [Bacteroidetes bacterium]|nr:LPXTG cell wall anchor domain-containing protein [Bacteroidota bacterium]
MNIAIFAGVFVVVVLGGWFVVNRRKKSKDKESR